MSCSLKSIARLVGLVPLEVDRTHIHDLSHEALHAYASSDARLARVLTERRWSSASRFVDRMDPRTAPPWVPTRRVPPDSGHSTQIAAGRGQTGRMSTLHYSDSQAEIHKVVVGPMDNNVFVLRCRETGDAVLLDAANEHERLLDLCRELHVRSVLETHGHWDHIQAVPAAARRRLLGARHRRKTPRCCRPTTRSSTTTR